MIKKQLRLVTKAESDASTVYITLDGASVKLIAENDLHFDSSYQKSSIILDETALKQKLLIKLAFFQGSYIYNTVYGLPYYQEILTQSPNQILLNGIFVDAITATLGVDKIDDPGLEFDFDRATRTFSIVKGQIIAETGEVVSIGGLII